MSSEDISRELNEADGRAPQEPAEGGAKPEPKPKNPTALTAEAEEELRQMYPTMYEQADEKARARKVETEQRQGEDVIAHTQRVAEERLRQMYPKSYGAMRAHDMQRQSTERDRQDEDREIMRELYPQQYSEQVLGLNGEVVQMEVEGEDE